MTKSDDEILASQCNICRCEVLRFIESFPGGGKTRCPICGSFERHRILKDVYENQIKPIFNFQNKKVLICTPSKAESDYLLSDAAKVISFDIRPVDWFDLQMDICNMSNIESNSVDAFIAIAVLQHVDDDIKAINEVWRVLKPGGWFFVQASNLYSGNTTPFDQKHKHYTEEEFKKYRVATYRVYGLQNLKDLIASKFSVRSFYGRDPVTLGADHIICGVK